MNIAWVPHIPQVLENKFFLEDGRDNSQKPYKELRNLLEAQGIHLNTIDMYSDLGEVDFVIFAYHNRMNIRYYCELLRRGELNKAIYMAYEPPIVEQIHERENLQQMNAFFPTVFTWNDSCVDGKQFRKMVYPQYISNEDIAWTPFSERKLLTCISGFKASSNDIDANDLYQERLRVIDFFQNNQTDFEHYGFGWDKNKYKNYKGTIDKKKDVYHKYRFALCLENMSGEPGYISEKINDCINCGVVPIYGGGTKY